MRGSSVVFVMGAVAALLVGVLAICARMWMQGAGLLALAAAMAAIEVWGRRRGY